MNVRTKWVATEASYASVSLACEPWNTPTPRPTRPASAYKVADFSDPESKVIKAMKAGNVIFDHIAMAAFGTRTGKVDEVCRKTLLTLIDKGIVSRERALNLMGQPYIWTLIDG
jgi:hypothetical protein